jgi:ATP-binding protein involved in chromosome partitioning
MPKKGLPCIAQAQLNVPIIGFDRKTWLILLRRMPDNKYYIFGKEGGKRLAEEYDLPFIRTDTLVQTYVKAAMKVSCYDE